MANKKVIDSLTPEQEALLDVYYEKWLAIGLKSCPTTPEMRQKAEEFIRQAYRNENLQEPQIIWTRSPLEGARKCLELGDSKDGLLSAAGYGSHDAGWLSFYDYMMNVLGLVEECKDLVPLIEMAQLVGWWWPYDKICVASELPLETHVNADGALHRDGGPCIRYSDGFEMFYLNGIEVPENIARMPASEITKEIILRESNADVRREIVKKVGIVRAEEILGSVVSDTEKFDVGGIYELLMIDYDAQGKNRPHLKMKNPSIGTYHIEGVKPECANVRDAILYRNGLLTFVMPENIS